MEKNELWVFFDFGILILGHKAVFGGTWCLLGFYGSHMLYFPKRKAVIGPLIWGGPENSKARYQTKGCGKQKPDLAGENQP